MLDENGNKLGYSKSRSEIHQTSEWHGASHVWIMNTKRKLLLNRRSLSAGTSPGAWTMSAGGHVDSGESPLQAAIMETKEEIGVEFSKDEFKQIFISTFKSGNLFPGKKVNQFHYVFIVNSDLLLEDCKEDENEVIDIKFVHHEELKRQIKQGEIEMVPHPEQFGKLFEYLQDYTVEPGLHKIGLPERPFRAIKNATKIGEIRINVPQSGFDYYSVKSGDKIQFFHEETIVKEVKKIIRADSKKKTA